MLGPNSGIRWEDQEPDTERGFAAAEFGHRFGRAQRLMSEPNVCYLSGFLTQYWQSPTRLGVTCADHFAAMCGRLATTTHFETVLIKDGRPLQP